MQVELSGFIPGGTSVPVAKKGVSQPHTLSFSLFLPILLSLLRPDGWAVPGTLAGGNGGGVLEEEPASAPAAVSDVAGSGSRGEAAGVQPVGVPEGGPATGGGLVGSVDECLEHGAGPLGLLSGPAAEGVLLRGSGDLQAPVLPLGRQEINPGLEQAPGNGREANPAQGSGREANPAPGSGREASPGLEKMLGGGQETSGGAPSKAHEPQVRNEYSEARISEARFFLNHGDLELPSVVRIREIARGQGVMLSKAAEQMISESPGEAFWARAPAETRGTEGTNSTTRTFTEVATQIADRMEMLVSNRKSEVIVELKPETLGRVKVEVSLRDGVISARLMVENAEVGHLLNSHLGQLKETFQHRGLKLDQLSVHVGTGYDFEGSDGGFMSRREWPAYRMVAETKVEDGSFSSLMVNYLA